MHRIIKSKFFGLDMDNPFMLASGPPTNTAEQVLKAFEKGWGGAVWKTIGIQCQNVFSRYGGIKSSDGNLIGMNNIELISDRSIEDNLKDIVRVKKKFPKKILVASIMAEYNKTAWKEIAKKSEDAGSDALELNLSCPHGLPEKELGAVYGQNPNLTAEVTSWVKHAVKIPVIVKLTPNITDIRFPARAAIKAGADGIALINTINSIIGIDLHTLTPLPSVAGKTTHGGYSGPAVKPIALHHLSSIANDNIPKSVHLSGMGGIRTWRDAAEFILLGAGTVQICTEAMRRGFSIIHLLTSGLQKWMIKNGFESVDDMRGKALKNIVQFNKLDKTYKTTAEINQKKCIKCGDCYTACSEGCYQSVKKHRENDEIIYTIDHERCVGCNMCALICPEKCIKMINFSG